MTWTTTLRFDWARRGWLSLCLLLPACQTGDPEPPVIVREAADPQQEAHRAETSSASLWVSATEQRLVKLTGHGDSMTSFAMSSDGIWGLSGSLDGTARLWDLSLARQEKRFGDAHQPVTAVAISADGHWGLTGSQDKTVRLYDLKRGVALRAWRDPLRGVTALSFSADGKLAAAGGADGTIRVWDLGKGKILKNIRAHAKPVNQLAFSPDGSRLLSAGDDKAAAIWPLQGTAAGAKLSGHAGWVTSAVFSPDGSQVLTGGADRSVRLWSASGALLRTFGEARGGVSRVQFLAGGRLVAAALMPALAAKGAAYDVDIWDKDNGRPVLRLTGHRGLIVALAPLNEDGVLTASADETLRFWTLPSGGVLKHANP